MHNEPEKYCSRCQEWWPADTEFFFRSASTSDGLGYTCKACYFESPSVRRRNAHKANGYMYSPWERLFRSDEIRSGT